MVAAAGSGERLGAGGPKALLELAGRPLLAWSLAAWAEAGPPGPAIVAAPPGREAEAEAIAAAALGERGGEAVAVAGGEARPESVRAATERVGTELVVIHDAARPLASAALLDGVIELLASRPDADGAIAAAPLADTVKRAREPRRQGGVPRGGPTVAETLSREHLWAAQTPQVFRAAKLREAQERAAASGALRAATDEAMLVERAGGKVLILEAPPTNLKVTTEDDLRLASLLLSERN